MAGKSDSKRLSNIDKQLLEISKQVSFIDINPDNEDSEKALFFSNPDYNPQFKYLPLKTPPEKILKELDKLDLGYTPMDKIFRKSASRLRSLVKMLESRGSVRSCRISEKIYGTPSPALVAKAKDMLSEPIKKSAKEKDLTTKQILRMMNNAFVRFGANWTVMEKDMAASAAVLAGKRQLLIRTKSRFPKSFVKRLIVHEIGTHVLRAENGSKQPYKIFEHGLPDYMMTEEGLAVYNEELNKCLDKETMRRYAARTIAISKALNSSFRETFNHLKQFFDDDEFIWRTVVRAKRGLGDTSQHGAFTKDHLYLKGYYEVKSFVEKGGDISKLYYGKVGIDDVPDLDKIPGLIHPMYLPFFRYFQFLIEFINELVKFNIKVFLKPVLYPLDIRNYKKLFDAIIKKKQ